MYLPSALQILPLYCNANGKRVLVAACLFISICIKTVIKRMEQLPIRDRIDLVQINWKWIKAICSFHVFHFQKHILILKQLSICLQIYDMGDIVVMCLSPLMLTRPTPLQTFREKSLLPLMERGRSHFSLWWKEGEVGQTFNYFSLGFTGVKRKSSNNQGDWTSPSGIWQGDLAHQRETMSPTSPCLVSPIIVMSLNPAQTRWTWCNIMW